MTVGNNKKVRNKTNKGETKNIKRGKLNETEIKRVEKGQKIRYIKYTSYPPSI